MTAANPLPALPEHLSASLDENAPEDYSIRIPGRIVRMSGLSLTEKAMLAMVDNFHRNGRGCYASNTFFAERLSVTTREITRMIDDLTSRGYLTAAHYRNPKQCGGRIRFLSPTALVPLENAKPATKGIDNPSIQSGQSFHTPTTNGRNSIDNSSRESRHAPACPCLESVSNPVVEPEKTTTPLPPKVAVREQPAAVVAIATEPTEGFRLLAKSCGGLGLDDESARKLSGSLQMEDIKARILWAKDKKSPAGFFKAMVERGVSVPEDFLRAVRPTVTVTEWLRKEREKPTTASMSKEWRRGEMLKGARDWQPWMIKQVFEPMKARWAAEDAAEAAGEEPEPVLVEPAPKPKPWPTSEPLQPVSALKQAVLDQILGASAQSSAHTAGG